MAGFGIYANQHRIIARLSFLQGSSKLKAMSRYYTVVMIGSGNHRCRIANSLFYIMQGRILNQVLKLIFMIAAAVLYRPAPAYSKFMIAQHIQNTYRRQGYPK